MVTIQSIDAITTDPNVRGGRPCLAGTEVRVIDVVMAHLFHQRNPSEIAADYELPLAHVYAALAYYFDHKPGLDADIRQQLAAARQAKDQRLGSAALFLS